MRLGHPHISQKFPLLKHSSNLHRQARFQVKLVPKHLNNPIQVQQNHDFPLVLYFFFTQRKPVRLKF